MTLKIFIDMLEDQVIQDDDLIGVTWGETPINDESGCK